AGVVGGALFASQPPGLYGALPAAVLAALLTAMISGWSMVVLRRSIGVKLTRSRDRIEDGSRDALMSLHLTGMSLDLLRGATVTLVGMLVFSPLVHAIAMIWETSPATSRAVVVVAAAIVAGGALWKVFHSVPYVLYFFFAGLAASTVIGWVR
ncbi:MAG: hypothetical protein M3365_03130, partial [Gemmatimonadota bacterium]|nr:hypothetical protein [Gemmatimonadota bacterium]